MWLFFALLAPLFWAIVHVLDEYCVDEVLEKPWMGVVTSSASSIVLYFAFPFVLPWIDFSGITIELLILAIIAGVFIQLSQAFYFQALSFSDAGIVSAYWNLIPFILPIATFIFLDQIFTPLQYLGIIILISSSTLMCLLDYHQKTKFYTFGLMFIAAIFQVAAYLLMEYIYHHSDFILAYFAVTTGIIITGLSPLAFNGPRKSFLKALQKILPSLRFFILIEIANLAALLMAHLAIRYGDAALVAAVETTVPAFVFVVSAYWIHKSNVSGKAMWNKISAKLIVVLFMAYGVWLVS